VRDSFVPVFPKQNKKRTEHDQATRRKTYRGRARDDERGGGSRDDRNVPVSRGRREEEGPRCRSSVLFPLRPSGDLAGSSSWVSADRRPVGGRSRCCSLCSRAKERPACEATRTQRCDSRKQWCSHNNNYNYNYNNDDDDENNNKKQHNRTEHSTTQHNTTATRPTRLPNRAEQSTTQRSTSSCRASVL